MKNNGNDSDDNKSNPEDRYNEKKLKDNNRNNKYNTNKRHTRQKPMILIYHIQVMKKLPTLINITFIKTSRAYVFNLRCQYNHFRLKYFP